MGDRRDIAEINPELELTFGSHTLQCAGTLDGRTMRHVLEAMEFVLRGNPVTVDIDISGLHVADADGAITLVALQRMGNEAGIKLHWRGLDAQLVSDGIAV